MTGRKIRRPLEFKKDIVNQVLSGAKVSDLARQHNIHPSLISKWVRLFTDGGGLSTAKGGFSEQEREVQRLQAELKRYKEKVGEQALAIDLLKKAIEDSERRRKLSGSVVTGMSLDPSKGRAK